MTLDIATTELFKKILYAGGQNMLLSESDLPHRDMSSNATMLR